MRGRTQALAGLYFGVGKLMLTQRAELSVKRGFECRTRLAARDIGGEIGEIFDHTVVIQDAQDGDHHQIADGEAVLERVVIDEPQVVLRSSSMFAQQSAAANGAGLVLLPAFAGETDARLVPVLKPLVRTERPIFLAIHQDLEYVPRIRAVARFLEETIAADQGFLLQS